MSTVSAELVERVVEVTGASQTEAEHLLGACANDVESAVALYFEQGGGDGLDVAPGGGAPAAAAASTDAFPNAANNGDEDEVRAPIAPIREQLIGPAEADDNFFASIPSPTGRRTRVSQQRVKICPLRDFAREGALMEEQIQAAVSAPGGSIALPAEGFGPSTRLKRRARAAGMVSAAQSSEPKASSSRLGDLFRPPTDIAYAGTFQSARSRATACKHWLLVNVQSDNFDSQVLNRDVWSDKGVRKLIRQQFILWQIDSDSSEGRRFVAFYHCAKLPYVCIIDPRTGEEVWKSSEPKQSNLLPDMEKFLREHKDFSSELDGDAPSTSKRSTTECINLDDEEDTPGSARKRSKVVEMSEEEQIALAIRNSMRENGMKGTKSTAAENDDDDTDFDSDDEFGEDDTKGACEHTSYEAQLGVAKHDLTTLKLRLINAKENEEVIQLRWPSDTQLRVLRVYISQQHPHIPKQGAYKLICAFPRKTLETEHDNCTLKELGLHPSANLHLTVEE